jgi:MFS family permease
VYGRRFILIVCSLICLGATIWHGAAQSYGSFMGARIFISIGMSISESLMPMVVSDVFFLHERGFYMGIYFFALFNSMFLGPLIAGACAQHFSTWRTFYWIITAFAAASFLSVIFLHPETKYIRHLPDVAPAASPRPSGEKNQIGQLEVPANTDSETSQTIDTDQYLGRGRPTKQQFRLIQAGDRDAMSKVSRHIITPFSLLQFPIVIFGAWMLAFSASGLLTLNYIQSGALTAPPYNFDDGQVGLSNLALVCGGTLGMFTAGPLSDWVANYQTKRNRGVREPEMRLVSMIPFVILSAIGMVVVGVGFDRKWPWEAVIVVGFGAVGLMTVSLSTIGITVCNPCPLLLNHLTRIISPNHCIVCCRLL